MARTSADNTHEGKITNADMLAHGRKLQHHAEYGVDFGFLTWIVGAVALMGAGVWLARMSARLGWIVVGLIGVGGLAAAAYGVLQDENDMASLGLIGVGAALALAGVSRYWRRGGPPPPIRKPARA